MSLRMALATIGAALDAELAHLAGGVVRLRTGAQPANPETAATGTLVGTLTLPNPAGTRTGNVITIGDVTPEAAADADGGNAGWFRAYRADGTTPVLDGTYGLAGSGADMIISVAIVTGAPIDITAMTLTLPVSA